MLNSKRAHPLKLPPPRLDEWSWQSQGTCQGHPIETFFPDDTRGRALHRREERAKTICRACPVVVVCRDFALNTPELHGIWGGTTARERAVLLSTPLHAPESRRIHPAPAAPRVGPGGTAGAKSSGRHREPL